MIETEVKQGGDNGFVHYGCLSGELPEDLTPELFFLLISFLFIKIHRKYTEIQKRLYSLDIQYSGNFADASTLGFMLSQHENREYIVPILVWIKVVIGELLNFRNKQSVPMNGLGVS